MPDNVGGQNAGGAAGTGGAAAGAGGEAAKVAGAGGAPAAGAGGAGDGQGGHQAGGADNGAGTAGKGDAGGDAAGKPNTILNADPNAAAAAKGPATWPDNWRDEMVKELPEADRAKELDRLKRFNSPNEVYRSNRELEKKMSSGEFKKPLGKDAKPEEVAAWRKENGIPEKPEDYLAGVKLKDGIVIGEQDRPYVDKFLQNLHAANASPEAVNQALNTYYDMVQDITVERLANFEKAKDTTFSALTQEWGTEYNKNINILQSFADSLPNGAGKHLLEGFGNDGIPLFSNPDVVRGILAIAKQANPGFTLSLPGGQSDVKSIESRKSELTKMMGDPMSAYWKGDQAAAMQEEFRNIDRALSAIKTKAA